MQNQQIILTAYIQYPNINKLDLYDVTCFMYYDNIVMQNTPTLINIHTNKQHDGVFGEISSKIRYSEIPEGTYRLEYNSNITWKPEHIIIGNVGVKSI